jgi:hypothetical protein
VCEVDLAPKVLLDQNSGIVTNTPPIITGHVLDNLSGVASLQVQIDGGPLINVVLGDGFSRFRSISVRIGGRRTF